MKPVVLAILSLVGLTAFAQAAPGDASAGPAPASPTVGDAAAGRPDAADLLFEQPQMRNTTPGSTLTYDYLRRSGILKGPFGPPLKDEIKLMIEPGEAAESRDIRVQMFSGQNRFPAGPFEDMSGNPVLTLFLEHHLRDLAKVLEANPRYIKNAIRKGLRERATVAPTQIDYKGRKVDGWRIEAKPFEGDPQTQKFRGLENLTYTFVVSPEIPGEIVSIAAQAKDAEGGELLEERLNYDQNAG